MKTISAYVVLLLATCPTLLCANPVNYSVAFDLESEVDLKATSFLFPNSTATRTYNFINFPYIPLFANIDDQKKAAGLLGSWNTLFTIGSKSHYGLKLTYSKINVSNVQNTKMASMNYMPIFNFPLIMQAKIIDEAFKKIRGNEKVSLLILVLNASTVDMVRPWEYIEILNTLLEGVSGSLKFLYYRNNPVTIARTIRDTLVQDVILMVNAKATLEILRAANDRGLLKWRYRWLIYQLTSSSINLKNIGFEAHSENITVIQFGDRSNGTLDCKSPVECAVWDSVQIFKAVTNYLFSSTSTAEVPIEGKTGSFKFIPTNLKTPDTLNAVERTSWMMQIYRELGSTSRVVGNVTGVMDVANPNITISLESAPGHKSLSNEDVKKDIQKNPLRVITVLEPPFVQRKANFTGPFSTVNAADQLDGIVIEVGKAVMKDLNISYTIKIDPSGSYGAKQKDGQWSGMILQIMNGKADVAMAGFGITEERRTVVDFLASFMNYKGAVLLKENKNNGVSAMFNFLRPFDVKVWGMLAGSIVAVSVVLALLHCISPNKTNYSLYESFFFSVGSVFQGVTTTPPDQPSGRIVVCFWWFFSLIIVITYIANYGAYRTQIRIQGEITSLSNLLTQNYYTYGTVQHTSYDSLFSSSTFEYMQKINKMIRQEFKNGLIKDSATALKLVQEKNYAFIWDNAITKYLAYQHCLKSTSEFDQFQYAFVVPKHADFKSLLDLSIEKLKENGDIDNILKKYPFIKGTTINPKCQYVGFLGQIRKYIPKNLFSYASTDSLTLDQTLGIFGIMIAGCILSLLLALIECSCRLCCQKYQERKMMKQKVAKRKSEEYAP